MAVENGLIERMSQDMSGKGIQAKIVTIIMKEYGWDKERSFRCFLKNAGKKDLGRFIATYQTCQVYGVKLLVARAILDTVCCTSTDWLKAEHEWEKGEGA